MRRAKACLPANGRRRKRSKAKKGVSTRACESERGHPSLFFPTILLFVFLIVVFPLLKRRRLGNDPPNQPKVFFTSIVPSLVLTLQKTNESERSNPAKSCFVLFCFVLIVVSKQTQILSKQPQCLREKTFH